MSVRICVCGDEGVGKSSLITSLVKDVFVTHKIQPVLPQITLPPTLGTPENVTTVIVDTSALPHERTNLRKELRKSNVILLAYSDHYSYERVALFWMPFFRAQGVSVPVILCANKSDLMTNNTTPQIIEEEMLPVMAEFKEIDSCIRTSAREHHNINEVFYLCQKAVTHPVAPLFDSKELSLKPAAITALKRIFYLCDNDQDGLMNDEEILAFQKKVFDKDLLADDLTHIKQSVRDTARDPMTFLDGMTENEFITLCTLFVEKGRHETLWMILRKFQYTDSLSLKESFVHPKFDVPLHSSAELSPTGYRFFVDLFLLFDKDNDGGLSPSELTSLFAPTPGLPQSWTENAFPSCTVVDDLGHVTLQGWLAQWNMTTFMSPQITLEYLAYLGFETTQRGGTTVALQITASRKRRRKMSTGQKVERNVFLCYVLGKSHSGKSSLLNAFLHKPFDGTYHPTIKPLVAVNSVEMQGGKQVYLILWELGQQEPAILDNKSKLDSCDLICWTYDSSDADSWDYVVDTKAKYAGKGLDDVPSVYVATKADRDRVVQRTDLPPEIWCTDQGLQAPMHTSLKWGSVGEVFVHLAESSMYPSTAYPRSAMTDERSDRTPYYIVAGVTACTVAIAGILWHRYRSSTL